MRILNRLPSGRVFAVFDPQPQADGRAYLQTEKPKRFSTLSIYPESLCGIRVRL